jgi:monofunctional biosynthetic peptidoglycan transglycosylase
MDKRDSIDESRAAVSPSRDSRPERRRRRPSQAAGRVRTVLRQVRRAVFFMIGLFVIGSIFLVALYRDVPPPATPLMLLRLVGGHGIDYDWEPLDKISVLLIKATIAGEDGKFCHHNGFDWDAVDAAWERYQSGRGRLRGASTISMQTAKNLYLWPGRDWLRKALEVYFTALIELSWSKRRILEVYLNIIELGPGIYGAEAAARHYFGKSADRLSPDEAVRLAATIPDPLDRSPRTPGPEAAAHGEFIVRQIPSLPIWEPLPCGDPW